MEIVSGERMPTSIDLSREIECHGTRIKQKKKWEGSGDPTSSSYDYSSVRCSRNLAACAPGRPRRWFVFGHVRCKRPAALYRMRGLWRFFLNRPTRSTIENANSRRKCNRRIETMSVTRYVYRTYYRKRQGARWKTYSVKGKSQLSSRYITIARYAVMVNIFFTCRRVNEKSHKIETECIRVYSKFLNAMVYVSSIYLKQIIWYLL